MNNERFPPEFLRSVMWFLPTRDKANCLLVCRAWYQYISETSWFNNLSLKRGEKIIQAQDLFTLKPYLGKQIKHLSISEGHPPFEDIDLLATAICRIPELMPNVKTLECIEIPDSFNSDTSMYAEKWKELESIIDQSTRLLITKQLLNSNSCMYLKDLYITFRIHACLFGDIIQLLHNAPALKRITMLNVANVDITDLEKVHKDLPQLRHLTLRFATANLYASQEVVRNKQQQRQQLKIFPARQLVSFKFHFCNMQFRRKDDLVALNLSLLAKARWSSYIKLKYNHIDRIDESGNSDSEYTFSGRAKPAVTIK